MNYTTSYPKLYLETRLTTESTYRLDDTVRTANYYSTGVETVTETSNYTTTYDYFIPFTTTATGSISTYTTGTTTTFSTEEYNKSCYTSESKKTAYTYTNFSTTTRKYEDYIYSSTFKVIDTSCPASYTTTKSNAIIKVAANKSSIDSRYQFATSIYTTTGYYVTTYNETTSGRVYQTEVSTSRINRKSKTVTASILYKPVLNNETLSIAYMYWYYNENGEQIVTTENFTGTSIITFPLTLNINSVSGSINQESVTKSFNASINDNYATVTGTFTYQSYSNYTDYTYTTSTVDYNSNSIIAITSKTISKETITETYNAAITTSKTASISSVTTTYYDTISRTYTDSFNSSTTTSRALLSTKYTYSTENTSSYTSLDTDVTIPFYSYTLTDYKGTRSAVVTQKNLIYTTSDGIYEATYQTDTVSTDYYNTTEELTSYTVISTMKEQSYTTEENVTTSTGIEQINYPTITIVGTVNYQLYQKLGYYNSVRDTRTTENGYTVDRWHTTSFQENWDKTITYGGRIYAHYANTSIHGYSQTEDRAFRYSTDEANSKTNETYIWSNKYTMWSSYVPNSIYRTAYEDFSTMSSIDIGLATVTYSSKASTTYYETKELTYQNTIYSNTTTTVDTYSTYNTTTSSKSTYSGMHTLISPNKIMNEYNLKQYISKYEEHANSKFIANSITENTVDMSFVEGY